MKAEYGCGILALPDKFSILTESSEQKSAIYTVLMTHPDKVILALLSASLDKKPSFAELLFSTLINPFQRIAGFYSLGAGLVVIFCMSYLGVIAKVYFPGILDCLNSSIMKNPKIPLSFFLLVYQNLVSWIVLTVLFIIAAKIFQQKKMRIIDFFGTVALSRFPSRFGMVH